MANNSINGLKVLIICLVIINSCGIYGEEYTCYNEPNPCDPKYPCPVGARIPYPPNCYVYQQCLAPYEFVPIIPFQCAGGKILSNTTCDCTDGVCYNDTDCSPGSAIPSEPCFMNAIDTICWRDGFRVPDRFYCTRYFECNNNKLYPQECRGNARFFDFTERECTTDHGVCLTNPVDQCIETTLTSTSTTATTENPLTTLTTMFSTDQPTTLGETTIVVTTDSPSTVQPSTIGLTTAQPTTYNPSTVQQSTDNPTTLQPTTEKPTTFQPTSIEPTTEPTTESLTTIQATTNSPTTYQDTTAQPSSESITTTKSPTSEQLSTDNPTTFLPSTDSPTTFHPSTESPTTFQPSTESPTTFQPSTESSTTFQPSTESPTTFQPSTESPTTFHPSTESPTTFQPTTNNPTTFQPTTESPTTFQPTTHNPTSLQTLTDSTTTLEETTLDLTTEQPGDPTTEDPSPDTPSTPQRTMDTPTTSPLTTDIMTEQSTLHSTDFMSATPSVTTEATNFQTSTLVGTPTAKITTASVSPTSQQPTTGSSITPEFNHTSESTTTGFFSHPSGSITTVPSTSTGPLDGACEDIGYSGCKEGVRVAHMDCEKYFECITGDWSLRTCPDDRSVYNPKISKCDMGRFVDCSVPCKEYMSQTLKNTIIGVVCGAVAVVILALASLACVSKPPGDVVEDEDARSEDALGVYTISRPTLHKQFSTPQDFEPYLWDQGFTGPMNNNIQNGKHGGQLETLDIQGAEEGETGEEEEDDDDSSERDHDDDDSSERDHDDDSEDDRDDVRSISFGEDEVFEDHRNLIYMTEEERNMEHSRNKRVRIYRPVEAMQRHPSMDRRLSSEPFYDRNPVYVKSLANGPRPPNYGVIDV